ncbi:TrmH family RNA methyltransferase [Candidatus Dependentiae bacterium]|nr:MAG: TrmH family RNA methyltransferase [Candidatus Dependentiae bacterium]
MKPASDLLNAEPSQQEMELLIEKWYQQISEHKKNLIEQVLAQRTRYVTVALEDVFQPFNASAIIRTAEIFGLQDMHVISVKNQFKPSIGISRGAVKWLNIKEYEHPASCIAQLKKQGYIIAATCLNEKSIPIQDLPVNQKTALLFGNELVGLSKESIALADIPVHIPMYGFTKSFNVSVSVALCLQQLIAKIRTSPTIPWRLNDEEKRAIEYRWCQQLIKRK